MQFRPLTAPLLAQPHSTASRAGTGDAAARNAELTAAAVPRSRSYDPEGTDESADADWASLLPDPGTGPEAAYLRSALLEELAAAIAQLPPAQREVFIAHELTGESFAAMAARTGVGINTLLARKHYAVQYLRRQLADWRDEFLD